MIDNKRLQNPDFRFAPLPDNKKAPPPEGWTTKNFTWEQIKSTNYAVVTGFGGLIVLDVDCEQGKNLISLLPKTFTVQTSLKSPRFRGLHAYFVCPEIDEKIILFDYDKHIGEIQTRGQYVVGPSSIHPSGTVYDVLEDVPIAAITKKQIMDIISPFIKEKEAISITAAMKEESDPICKSIKEKLRLSQVMKKYNMDINKNPGMCPWHKCTNHCFSWDDSSGLWHCFDTECMRSGNMFHLVMQMETCDFKTAKDKLEKMCDVKVKKKPQKEEKPKLTSFRRNSTHMAEMIYQPGKKGFMVYDMKTKKIELANKFEGYEPYNSEMVEKGVVLFPTTTIGYENERNLIEDIQSFIHAYCDVSEFFEKLAAYYVMFTWVYDNFNTLPYLRVLGDYGTGKTRFLQTVGSICYKPMFAGGATTPSPVFRIIEMFKGTLVLDEADFKASDDWSEIIKILNCGFQAGFPVLRTEEREGVREPRAYDCYCPKILATRREFKDKALESRCLTEKLMETSRHDIPLLLDKNFHTKTQELRNKLLMFRFNHFEKHEIDTTQQDRTIEKRLSQVIMSIYSIIDDPKIREEIGGFLKEYNKKLIEDRGERYEAVVLEEMFRITSKRVEDGRRNEKLYMKTVLDSINIEFDNDKEKMTSQKMGWIVKKKLLLDVIKDRNGRYILWDNERFFKLIKKYGICDEVTFVTIYRGASDKRHTHKRDDMGGHPVGSSQSSLRHTGDDENKP